MCVRARRAWDGNRIRTQRVGRQGELERLRARVKSEQAEREKALEAKQALERELQASHARGAGARARAIACLTRSRRSRRSIERARSGVAAPDGAAAARARATVLEQKLASVGERDAALDALQSEKARFLELVEEQSRLERELQQRRELADKALVDVEQLRADIALKSNREATLETQLADANATIVSLRQSNRELAESLDEARDLEDAYDACRAKLEQAQREVLRLSSEVGVRVCVFV